MSTQQYLASGNYADHNLYARERALNSAIVGADISRGWEEYLEIPDAFYADHVKVTDETTSGAVAGRERVRILLFKFPGPASCYGRDWRPFDTDSREPDHGDSADDTHSAWSVELTGVSGRTCKLNWCTLRRWADSRVLYERHYDHQQTGGPLTGTIFV